MPFLAMSSEDDAFRVDRCLRRPVARAKCLFVHMASSPGPRQACFRTRRADFLFCKSRQIADAFDERAAWGSSLSRGDDPERLCAFTFSRRRDSASESTPSVRVALSCDFAKGRCEGARVSTRWQILVACDARCVSGPRREAIRGQK